jgi:SAM-dependent methyltransferase
MLSPITRGLRSWLPLPAWWIVARHLDREAATMLDVGCGQGGPIQYIRPRRGVSAVGADIFLPYLRQHLRDGAYEGLVLCDVRRLPFDPGSFDVVFCGEVLEHLEENEGRKLLTSIERIARRQVIITTPVGHCAQHPYDDNEYQAHRSAWTPGALRRLGYRVRGSGLRGMGGLIAQENSPLPEWLRFVANVVWMAATPLTYCLPGLAGSMVCVKDVATPETGNANRRL